MLSRLLAARQVTPGEPDGWPCWCRDFWFCPNKITLGAFLFVCVYQAFYSDSVWGIKYECLRVCVLDVSAFVCVCERTHHRRFPADATQIACASPITKGTLDNNIFSYFTESGPKVACCLPSLLVFHLNLINPLKDFVQISALAALQLAFIESSSSLRKKWNQQNDWRHLMESNKTDFICEM